MKLKSATFDDLMEVAAWITTADECQLWAGPLVTFPIDIDVLAREISFCEGDAFVAVIDNEVVGFGQAISSKTESRHLARIIVHPQKRGSGLGYQLVESLVAIAFEDVPRVTLNVYPSNQKAITVYRKQGFREVVDVDSTEYVFMERIKKAAH